MQLPVYKGGEVAAWAEVDARDYERLAQYRWRLDWHGYVRRASGRRGIDVSLHRDVLQLARGDGAVVDHISRDKLDNRRANLRVGTDAENAQNRRKRDGVSSRFMCVTWNKACGKWQAFVTVNARAHHLGLFEVEEDAAAAAAAFRAEHMPFSPEARVT